MMDSSSSVSPSIILMTKSTGILAATEGSGDAAHSSGTASSAAESSCDSLGASEQRSLSTMYCAKDRSSSNSWTLCSGSLITFHPLTKVDCKSNVEPKGPNAAAFPSVFTSGRAAFRPCVETSSASKAWPVSAFKVEVFPALPCPTNISFRVRGRSLPCFSASRKASWAAWFCSMASAREAAVPPAPPPLGELSSDIAAWRCCVRCSETVSDARLLAKVSFAPLPLEENCKALAICFRLAAAAVLEKGMAGEAGAAGVALLLLLPPPPPLAPAAGPGAAKGTCLDTAGRRSFGLAPLLSAMLARMVAPKSPRLPLVLGAPPPPRPAKLAPATRAED
mmetsp:Transcript_165019/g.529770  ORF Transcript_165019/g.529770 Transcript_165019/m.529770 type:complete len:336 (+) Transcript_165019:3423-4430(+)